MSARTAWVYIGLAAWLAAVWLGVLGGCGAGAAGGDDSGSGSSSTGAAAPAPASAGTATTRALASAGAPTTTTPLVDKSGPGTTLGLRPTSLAVLSAEIRGLLGESGVPVYLPLAMPLGYEVAAPPPEGQGQEKSNPAAWQLGGIRPGPRAAGYAVLYTDGTHAVSLDVNPAADLGDVRWADGGINGVYGPLRTTSAAHTTWVSVADPDGVEIIVWGATDLSKALLFLASQVTRVD